MSNPTRITIRFGEPLRRSVGAFRLTVDLPAPATLNTLLHHLSRHYPMFGEAFSGKSLNAHYPYIIFVNHNALPTDRYNTQPLTDNDLVHIVLPVTGGKPFFKQPQKEPPR